MILPKEKGETSKQVLATEWKVRPKKKKMWMERKPASLCILLLTTSIICILAKLKIYKNNRTTHLSMEPSSAVLDGSTLTLHPLTSIWRPVALFETEVL